MDENTAIHGQQEHVLPRHTLAAAAAIAAVADGTALLGPLIRLLSSSRCARNNTGSGIVTNRYAANMGRTGTACNWCPAGGAFLLLSLLPRGKYWKKLTRQTRVLLQLQLLLIQLCLFLAY